MASVYNTIGVTYGNLGDCNKALFYYEKSLAIRIRNFGENHPDLDYSYYNIGRAYFDLEDYEKAKAFYEKCLKIRINYLEENNPLIGNIYIDIGETLYSLGEYKKAILFHEMGLEIFKKNHTVDNSDLVYAFWCLGNSLIKLKDFHRAIRILHDGFNIQREGILAYNLAQCYEYTGNKNEALRYFIESAEIRNNDSNCGLEDESTIESIENSKRLAKELGKEDELPEWMFNL